MEDRHFSEDNQSRISFKIGGSRADVKTNESSPSEETRSSLEELSNGVKKCLGESVIFGLSQSSTMSASQDIFATQLQDTPPLDSSSPLQSVGSTSGLADYDDFVLASQTQLDEDTKVPCSSHSPLSAKTSTPRKRKPIESVAMLNVPKLQPITEETIQCPLKKHVRSQTSVDRSVHLPSKHQVSDDELSLPNLKRPRQELDHVSKLVVKNKSTDHTLNQARFKVPDDDCQFIRDSSKDSVKRVETITIDHIQTAVTKEDSPEIKVFNKKCRESLEVLFVRSPAKGSSLQQSFSQKHSSLVETQQDSMNFHLSYDSPTQTVESGNNGQEGGVTKPEVEIKSITIDDDDQDCAVTYDDKKTIRYNIPPPLSRVPREEKQRSFISGAESCITPEVNGTLHSNLKSCTYSATGTVTWKILYDPLTQKIFSSELTQFEPFASSDDAVHSSRGLSDLSNGALADVSDQSKTNSPSSVAGIGPFPLQPSLRTSMISTVSSSSTGTSSSGGSVGAIGIKLLGHSNFPSAAYPKDRVLTPSDNDQMNVAHKNAHYNVTIPEKVAEKIHRTLENYVAKIAAEECVFISPKASTAKKDKTEASLTTKSNDFLLPVRCTPNENEFMNKLNKTPCIARETQEECTPLNSSGQKTVNPDTSSTFDPNSSKSLISETASETPKSTKKRCRATKPRTKKSSKSFTGNKDQVINETIYEEDEKHIKTSTQKNKVKLVKKTPKSSPASRRRVIVEEDPLPQEEAINLPVFARWTDKKYYSGKILSQVKEGRYKILFDDGNKKDILDEHVYIVEELAKGNLVFAEVDGTHGYLSGVIVDMKVIDNVVMYVVELDNDHKLVTVPRSQLFMTEDQVKLLFETDERPSMSPASGVKSDTMFKVVPDNILTGKRIRSLQAGRAGFSGQGKFVNTSFGVTSLESEDLSSDDESGVEKEHYPRTNPNCRKGSSIELSRQMKERALHDPPKSKIFQGMNFLFTCSAYSGPIHSGTSGDSTTSDGMAPQLRVQFIKDALTTQLKAGGGVVLNSFDDIENFNLPHNSVYLISNGPCLTATYMLCLCYNITILNHEWVIFSSLEGKKQSFNSYYLPAGYSIEKQMYVEQHTGGTRRKRPLSNKNVVLISSKVNSTFAKFWTKVLECLGARVTPMASKPDKDMVEGINIIVAAPSLMRDLRDWVQQLHLTAVSTEWMQQCVINWKECAVTPSSESPTY